METLENLETERLTPPIRTNIIAAAYRRPWTLVVVLTVIYAYSFLDRAIINLLVEPIEASLHLNDTQMSILAGAAFGIFYTIATVPAGFMVDQMDRRWLIGVSSFAWAVMTLVCSVATGYGHMFFGRAGMGLAEAIVGPAAFSLIRDGVSERWRGTAFTIYAMAPLFGSAFAFVGGGILLHAINAGAFSGWRAIATVQPWREVIGVAGLLGLPLSLLLFAVREPARGTIGMPASESGNPVAGPGSTALALAHIRENFTFYALLSGYVTFGAMTAFGQGTWLPTALSRRWSLPPEQAGQMFGMLALVFGMLGLILTSILLRRMAASGRDIHGFGALAALLCAAGLAGAVFAPTLHLSLAGTAVGEFFFGVSFPVGATTLAKFAPAPLMGRISAVYLMFQTMVGQSLGPLLITMTAKLFHGPDSLSPGFGTAMIVFGVASAACALAVPGVLKKHAHDVNENAVLENRA